MPASAPLIAASTTPSAAPALRVVHVVLTLDKGGLEQTALTLSRSIREAGGEAAIVALDGGGSTFDAAIREGIPCISLGGRRMGSPAYHYRLFQEFSRLRPTVIHTHHLGALVQILPVRMMLGRLRLIHTEHSGHYLAERPRTVPMLRWASRLVGKIVLVADAMEPLYRDGVGIPAERLQVIHNGVDTARFAPSTRRDQLRGQLGLARESLLIGSVGRLVPVKNYPLLLEAVAALRREGRSVDLVLAGDGPDRQALEARAIQLGIGERVRMPGWLTDPTDLLGALDAFVLTSDAEALPLALLEAMSSGVAPVATAVGEIPKVLGNDEAGLLFPVGDLDALVDRLRRLAVDPSLRVRLGAAARLRVEGQYSLRSMVDAYFALYGAR